MVWWLRIHLPGQGTWVPSLVSELRSHVFVCVLSHFSHVQITSTPWTVSPPGSSAHGDSPGTNIGVGCHAFLQGIFPTQGSNLRLLSPPLAGRFFTTRTTWDAPKLPQAAGQLSLHPAMRNPQEALTQLQRPSDRQKTSKKLKANTNASHRGSTEEIYDECRKAMPHFETSASLAWTSPVSQPQALSLLHPPHHQTPSKARIQSLEPSAAPWPRGGLTPQVGMWAVSCSQPKPTLPA